MYIHQEIQKMILPLLEKYDMQLVELIGEVNHACWELSVLNEAWAMIPRDEYKSIVWTQEMAEAFGIAQPLLDEGDQVAARMAFKEAYARIVDSNKQHGISIKWFPSLGRDVEMRNAALTEAVRLGRIGVEHAASLLPPDQSIELLKNIKQSLAIKDDSNVKKIESLVDGLKLEKLL